MAYALNSVKSLKLLGRSEAALEYVCHMKHSQIEASLKIALLIETRSNFEVWHSVQMSCCALIVIGPLKALIENRTRYLALGERLHSHCATTG